MKGKTLASLVIAASLIAVLGCMIVTTEWNTEEGIQDIPFGPSEDTDFSETLNFAIFETYGPLMLVVALLLFGAIIGAACLSQEEEE